MTAGVLYYRDYVCLAGEDTPFVMSWVFGALHGLMRQTGEYAVCLPMASQTRLVTQGAPARLRMIYEREGQLDDFRTPEPVEEAVKVIREKSTRLTPATRFVRVSRLRPERSSARAKSRGHPGIHDEAERTRYIERTVAREQVKRRQALAGAWFAYRSATNGNQFLVELCVTETSETAFRATGSFGTGVAPIIQQPVI